MPSFKGGSRADEESAVGWRNMFKTELAGISIGCFLKAFAKITPGVYRAVLAHWCVLTIVTPFEVWCSWVWDGLFWHEAVRNCKMVLGWRTEYYWENKLWLFGITVTGMCQPSVHTDICHAYRCMIFLHDVFRKADCLGFFTFTAGTEEDQLLTICMFVTHAK